MSCLLHIKLNYLSFRAWCKLWKVPISAWCEHVSWILVSPNVLHKIWKTDPSFGIVLSLLSPVLKLSKHLRLSAFYITLANEQVARWLIALTVRHCLVSFRLRAGVHRGHRSELQRPPVGDSRWDYVPGLGLSHSSWAQVSLGWTVSKLRRTHWFCEWCN